MTRITTNTPSPKFHEVESPTTEAAHVKPTAPPGLAQRNVVDAFVAGSSQRDQPASFSSPGRTFSVADLERMNPEQRAQTVGASVVQSAVYPREELEVYSLKLDGRQLVDEVGQYNDVSAKTMNGPDICAACSVVNAMILSGDGKASAAALEKVFKNTHARVPPPMTNADASRALVALRSGKVSEFDVAVLQQVAAAVLSKMQTAADSKNNDHSPGVSTPVLQSFIASLVEKGAPLKGATFELSANSQGAHWTTTSNGVHADSAPTREARKELSHFTV